MSHELFNYSTTPIDGLMELCKKHPDIRVITLHSMPKQTDLELIAEVIKPNYSNDMPLLEECLIRIYELKQAEVDLNYAHNHPWRFLLDHYWAWFSSFFLRYFV